MADRKKVIVSVSLDSDLVEDVRALAAADDRPFSRVVNKALTEFMDRQRSA